VLAVDSSLGDKMWPVSTVDGVISAVTARLPGQQITFRFGRVQGNVEAAAISAPAKIAVKDAPVAVGTNVPQKELLKRCREIIRRYTSKDQTKDKFVGKFSVPGLVADKVVDALASAGATVDRITLSMVMEAYLSCDQPQKAVEIFAAVVGLNANGSAEEAKSIIKGKEGMQIVANFDALDVFTVSALLKAHAKMGDLTSVKRVLLAMEGKSDTAVNDLQVAKWPGTGNDGELKPDTRCYNAVLSAAADSAATDGLDFALDMFERMSDPKSDDGSMAVRNLATYNIVINALANDGRFDEAIDMFYIVKKLGMKPDKFTYTALVKAAIAGGDAEELLYDMREQGVVGDAVTYNTVIKSLCDQRKLVSAKKIVTLMEESGVAPDSRTYGLLMNGLIRANKPSSALTLFETACSEQRTVPLTENVYLYTTAITAAAALGDHERALELLSRMSSLGIKPTMKTLTALVGACLSSGRPDLAVDVYRRISDPDGYAMAQGIRAFSENGNLEEALALITGIDRQQRILTGKQEMLCYKSLIETSLSSGNFVFATRMFDTILGRGDIPSKAMYLSIFDSMKLFPSTSNGRLRANPADDPDATEKFQFLLFVLDSIGNRNLPCDGPLYAAILSYGCRIGGLPKKIASLLVFAKAATGTCLDDKKLIDECTVSQESIVSTWTELFDSYDQIKDDLHQPSTTLPQLAVRVASRDMVKVLNAENQLSFVKRAKARA
jgi:pentatricopeptide repeat protein